MSLGCVSAAAMNLSAVAFSSIVPFGNGAWTYDTTYTTLATKGPNHAGLFASAIKQYNESATPGHTIDQIFSYGGDIEMYCAGSGGSDPSEPCLPNQFLVIFYPTSQVNARHNDWDVYLNQLGDSGYASLEQYKQINKRAKHVVVIDGRVDNPSEADYLNHLNTLSPENAAHFADKVAKTLCASDDVDGVQFDIEPFSFSGKGGANQGPGQRYFYTEIAKDFAGYYGNANDPAGVNPSLSSDPLHCVDQQHPNGRFFSVFTFTQAVTPEVASTLTHHGNGMIVDSLYDLGNKPGGEINSPATFKALVTAEVSRMKTIADTYQLPYQFAIPAAASAHEFESVDGESTGYAQLTYVESAIDVIQPDQLTLTDPNFKGVDVWSWNQQMLWHDRQFKPSQPSAAVLNYLNDRL